MGRFFSLSLAALLFTTVAHSQVARLDFFQSGDDLFRQQRGTCSMGYKSCNDGSGCCRIGEVCTLTSDIPICAAICRANVQTCTAEGVEYCCRDEAQGCDSIEPGYCTFGAGGGPTSTDGLPPSAAKTIMVTDSSMETTKDLYNPTSRTAPTLETTVASESDETATAPATTEGPSTTSDADNDSSGDNDETGGASAPEAPEEPDAGHRSDSANAGALVLAGLSFLIGLM